MIGANPDFLKGYVLCAKHDKGGRAPWTCPACTFPVKITPVPGMPEGMVVMGSLPSAVVLTNVGKPKQPKGRATERALYAQLEAAGYVRDRDWIAEYSWGIDLDPPRGFRFDVAFPARRLAVEVEGQVHSIKGRRKGDVLRRQLAEAYGWRVLSVLPEQVRAQEVVGMVRKALGEESEGFGKK